MNEPLTNNQIRAYCDGELSPEQATAVEQHLEAHPDDRRRVAFERALRESVGRAMREQAPAAPAGLAEGIRRAARETSGESLLESPSESSGKTTGREAVGAARLGSASYSGPDAGGMRIKPLRINYFAVAACLVLIGAAVLIGIFGPNINDRDPAENWAQQAAVHVAEEHLDCANAPQRLADRIEQYDPAQVERSLTRLLGRGQAVTVFDLSSLGYAFLGGGRCRVPGTEHDMAGHLIYERVQGSPGLVTVHVVPDVGQFEELFWEPAFGDVVTAIVPRGVCANDVSFVRGGEYIYIIVMCHADGLEELTERVSRLLVFDIGSGSTAP